MGAADAEVAASWAGRAGAAGGGEFERPGGRDAGAGARAADAAGRVRWRAAVR